MIGLRKKRRVALKNSSPFCCFGLHQCAVLPYAQVKFSRPAPTSKWYFTMPKSTFA